MAIQIRSNLASQIAINNLNQASNQIQKSVERLSSGLRINHAADDVGGFVVSTRLKSISGGLTQASLNIAQGVSLAQTAGGGLSSIISVLQSLRTDAVQAANGTLTTAQRNVIQNDVSSLVNQIDSIASTTTFNKIHLLNGSISSGTRTLTFQVGAQRGDTITLNIATSNAAALGVSGLDVSNSTSASAAITTLDTAIDRALSRSGTVGSTENRLNSSSAFVSGINLTLQTAIGNLTNSDLASEFARFTSLQITSQAATAALVQANKIPVDIVQSLVSAL